MPKIPSKTLLTGFRFHDENICLAKDTCFRLQNKYSQKLYPVCPILQEAIGKEKPSITKVPKTNLPLLDSIIKILVVVEGLMQLRPDLETVVWCVHSENFLKEQIDLIRHDLSALPQWLEKDFPDTSKKCKEFVAQLDLAELRYTMHSNSLVYFLPNDVEYGNWASFLEWQERKIENAKLQGLSEAIEMNRLTCHYPAEAIKVINKISRELCPLVKILLEKAEQSKREKIEQSQILARYLQKAAGTKVSIATRLKHLAETSLKSPKRIKPQEFHNVCYQLKLEVEEATQGLDEILFNLREKDQSGKADAIEKLLKKLFQLISPESQKRSDNLAPLYLELDEAKNCAITLADKINQITGTEQNATPAKRQRTKRIIGWIFKGFIALTLLLICLYVFGVVTGIFIFASVLTCLHLLGYLEQFNTLIDKILQLK